jgi:hypothetical protein
MVTLSPAAGTFLPGQVAGSDQLVALTAGAPAFWADSECAAEHDRRNQRCEKDRPRSFTHGDNSPNFGFAQYSEWQEHSVTIQRQSILDGCLQRVRHSSPGMMRLMNSSNIGTRRRAPEIGVARQLCDPFRPRV